MHALSPAPRPAAQLLRRGSPAQPHAPSSKLSPPAHASRRDPAPARPEQRRPAPALRRQAEGLLASAAACAVLLAALPPGAARAEGGALVGAELFRGSCAGCHAGGGNVVEPAQTLRQSGARPRSHGQAGGERATPARCHARSLARDDSPAPESADLERNGLTDPSAVRAIIYNGKARISSLAGRECAESNDAPKTWFLSAPASALAAPARS